MQRAGRSYGRLGLLQFPPTCTRSVSSFFGTSGFVYNLHEPSRPVITISSENRQTQSRAYTSHINPEPSASPHGKPYNATYSPISTSLYPLLSTTPRSKGQRKSHSHSTHANMKMQSAYVEKSNSDYFDAVPTRSSHTRPSTFSALRRKLCQFFGIVSSMLCV